MAKGQTRETYNAVKSSQSTANSNSNNLSTQNSGNTASANASASEGRPELESSYRGLTGSNSSIAVPSVDTGRLSSIGDRYRAFSETGGYGGDRRASVMDQVGQLKDFGRTGGLDSNSMSRMRGMGVFDEYADTGGYSNVDKANIRTRALAPISANAKAASDELGRRRIVQGGYMPGFDASTRALRRDTARSMADTSLDAELGIRDRVDANRQWGAGNVTSSEGAAQNLRTGNMYRGMTSAGDMEMSLQNNINNYMLAGMDGERATAMAIADIEGGNASRGLTQANADRSFNNSNYMTGLGGLQNLYNTDVSRVESGLDRGVGIESSRVNSDLGYYQPRTNLATQPGIGGNIMRGIGAAAGVGAALYAPSFRGMGAA